MKNKNILLVLIALAVICGGAIGFYIYASQSAETWRTAATRSISTEKLKERHQALGMFLEQEDIKADEEQYYSQIQYNEMITAVRAQLSDVEQIKKSIPAVPFIMTDKAEAQSERKKLLQELDQFANYNNEMIKRLESSKSISNSYQSVAGLNDTTKYSQMLQDVAKHLSKLSEEQFATALDKENAERFRRLAQLYLSANDAFSRQDRAAYDAAIEEFDTVFAANKARKSEYTAEQSARLKRGNELLRSIEESKSAIGA